MVGTRCCVTTAVSARVTHRSNTSRPLLLRGLTRFSNLTIKTMSIRMTSTVLPRAQSKLSLNILRIRTRHLNILRNNFSIQNIRDPIISNTNNRQNKITFPNFGNRITMTRRNTAILTVRRRSNRLGTRGLTMRLSNLVRIFNGRTKVLRINDRHNR